uniref:uncharacterized protein LOC122582341 n=1 Tax=Erigeron canadensis TaxID=72917 RepID=UPI001CB9B0C4|nr:uncharacterized protein LOC122582341 [Erigeron canadensis]
MRSLLLLRAKRLLGRMAIRDTVKDVPSKISSTTRLLFLMGRVEELLISEKMEAVISMSYCTYDQRVTYVVGCFVSDALSWWNNKIPVRVGRDAALAMSWREFKELMQAEFCPVHELQKLQIEFLQLTMVGADHASCTSRFYELSRFIPYLVDPKPKWIEKYIAGLEPHVRVQVVTAGPTTIQDVVSKAGSLTEELVRSDILSRGGSKRRELVETSTRREFRGDKRARMGRVYAATEMVQKGYVGQHLFCGKLPKCILTLEGYLFYIDLIPFGIGSFDVIFGMDWSRVDASIVCCAKILRIPMSDGHVLEIHGQRTETIDRHLICATDNVVKLADIPIMRDFSDVFPDDVVGLPPPRQVKFRIDLVPNAMPVAKSPYPLAPSEMQEIALQKKWSSRTEMLRTDISVSDT